MMHFGTACYQEFGQVVVSTTYSQNSISVSSTSNVSFSQPGVYPVIWTFQDFPTNQPGSFYVDDPDVYSSITIVVFKVNITEPSTWPYSIVVYSHKTVVAMVTPQEALGGTYEWVRDSGSASGYFVQEHDTDSTARFVAAQPGDYYFHVNYTKNGVTASSEQRRFIVFDMELLGLSFLNDHELTKYSNKSTITDPVWTATKNDPIAYTKNNLIDMTGKFALSTTLPGSTVVYIKADDNSSDNLDAIKTASVSALTTDIPGITICTTLQDKVHIASPNYQWYYSSDSIHWASAGSSGPHTIYVLYASPQEETLYDFALSKACNYASGESMILNISNKIRQGIRTDIDYDPNDGYINPDPLSCYTTGKQVCSDFANLMAYLSRSIGLSAYTEIVWGGVTDENTFNHQNTEVFFRSGNFYGTIVVNPGANVFSYHAVASVEGTRQDAALNKAGDVEIIYTAQDSIGDPYILGGEATTHHYKDAGPNIVGSETVFEVHDSGDTYP